MEEKLNPLPNKKYRIIYADPPYPYNVASAKGTSRGVAERYYKTMAEEEIIKIPVGKLTDNGVLFLWATCPNLPMALNIINAWGFTYKTVAFTWIKNYKHSKNLVMGCGFWTRANAEFCLLATKGKDYPRRIHKGVQQVIIEEQREHSRKPEEARMRIIKLLGDLPRIELFARTKWEGWDYWGLEVPKETQTSLK